MIPTTTPANASLPFSLQITAFGISIILAIFKTAEFFRKPKLSLNLTRDIFFRLIDKGEALFCNGVLLAIDGPILVRSVNVVLKKVDKHRNSEKAEKTFPLLVSQHGEKVRGANVIADHHFFGSSPLHYLEASKPYRAVYLCLQREYQDKQKRAVDDFSSAFEGFRAANIGSTDEDAPKLRGQFNELLEEHFHRMSSLIQLESGDYDLEMKVSYDCVGWKFFATQRQTSSTITFSVEDSLLEKWRADLKRVLSIRGEQIVSEKFGDVVYPSLEPLNVKEFSDQ